MFFQITVRLVRFMQHSRKENDKFSKNKFAHWNLKIFYFCLHIHIHIHIILFHTASASINVAKAYGLRQQTLLCTLWASQR